MKANELRVGNYTDKGMVKSFYEHGIHVGMGKCYLFRDLNPIQITEEILLKCGFERSSLENDVFFIEPFECIVKEDGYSAYFRLCWIADIRYLHQLQNLYFAITGKELEVKP